MSRLLERGSESRVAIIDSLLTQRNQTEEELVASTGVSKSTVRNVLGLLLEHNLANKARRRRDDGGRGPGPLEYWMTSRSGSAELVEKQLRELVEQPRPAPAAPTPPPAPSSRVVPVEPAGETQALYVLVKAGTNDAVLTKDGRMLRVERRALERAVSDYERVLRTRVEPMTVSTYYERYYPELRGRERPLW
jgi:predicted transcriptional regulator